MERRNLIVYDANGMIINQTGQAKGNILPHKLPVGVNYILDEYIENKDYRVIGVDVTEDVHKLITIPIGTYTEEELIIINKKLRIEELKVSLDERKPILDIMNEEDLQSYRDDQLEYKDLLG